jgi:hypothetical protein
MPERESASVVVAAWAQVASAVVGLLAAGAAVAVGMLTLQQGEKQRQEARTQQALQFFATFNSREMLETRELLENEDWCGRYRYRPPLLPDYQSPVTASHIVSLVDFFDLVHNSCGPDKLCDRNFAEQLFSPYAARLYENLSKEISDRRSQRGARFGEGMAILAGETAPLEEVVARHRSEKCGVSEPASGPG